MSGRMSGVGGEVRKDSQHSVLIWRWFGVFTIWTLETGAASPTQLSERSVANFVGGSKVRFISAKQSSRIKNLFFVFVF